MTRRRMPHSDRRQDADTPAAELNARANAAAADQGKMTLDPPIARLVNLNRKESRDRTDKSA